MPRDSKVYLEDMLEAATKVRRYTIGMTRDQLAENSIVLDAVVRNLEVLGEAAKNVPEDMRAAHPEVEWKRIAGLRDILIHQYFGVDVDIIWDIRQNKLPSLIEKVRGIHDS